MTSTTARVTCLAVTLSANWTENGAVSNCRNCCRGAAAPPKQGLQIYILHIYKVGVLVFIVFIFVFVVKSQKSLFLSTIHYLSGNWRDIINRSLRYVLSWGQLVSVALSKNHVLLWGQERGGKRKHILFTFVAFLKKS